MGAIAEAMSAYARPLIDETDGSIEQMQNALTITQLCWNLALLPKDDLDGALHEMRSSLPMDDREFADFRRSVVLPMIRRHHEMFPQMHHRAPVPMHRIDPAPPNRDAAEKYPGTERYAPCPCDSGRKYKFCCGAKSR